MSVTSSRCPTKSIRDRLMSSKSFCIGLVDLHERTRDLVHSNRRRVDGGARCVHLRDVASDLLIADAELRLLPTADGNLVARRLDLVVPNDLDLLAVNADA